MTVSGQGLLALRRLEEDPRNLSDQEFIALKEISPALHAAAMAIWSRAWEQPTDVYEKSIRKSATSRTSTPVRISRHRTVYIGRGLR